MTVDTVTLTAPGSPSSTWFKAIQNTLNTSHNVAMHFDIERELADPTWAVVLGYTDASNYYIMGVGTDRYPFVAQVKNGVSKTLCKIPRVAHLDGRVTITFRERRFLEDENDTWHCFSMWIDERHMLTHLEKVPGILSNPKMGFAAWTGSTISYTNITIPQMLEFVDWISIDPGEPPVRALERAIEGQYIKYFIRWNGDIRAWIPKASEVTRTYVDDDIFERSRQFDARELKTHVRQLGAYTQAEYRRTDLIQKYGHRFAEISNPYLMTESECLRQAERAIKRMEEAADVESMTVVYNPLLEVEDRITTPTGDRIITSRSISTEKTAAQEDITARKYTYA